MESGVVLAFLQKKLGSVFEERDLVCEDGLARDTERLDPVGSLYIIVDFLLNHLVVLRRFKPFQIAEHAQNIDKYEQIYRE